jgi:AraC-like DNA-binding protein
MDPLSDVLSLMRPRNYMSSGLDAGGAWAIQFPQQGMEIKTGAVVTGQCWLRLEGAEPVRLHEGDCFLLAGGKPFWLGSDSGVPSEDASSVFRNSRNGGVVRHGGGGDCFLVSSQFALDGGDAGRLRRMLPPVVHIRGEPETAALRWPVERMMKELREPRPGGPLLLQQLSQMMLTEALRMHIAQGGDGKAGWLSALGDARIGTVMTAIHAHPSRRWTLRDLAEEAGMSRSTFALRFRGLVGETPMEYLTGWRMLLAADRLGRTSDPISLIGVELGYESESAFSKAFKKTMGCAPRRYARLSMPVHGQAGVDGSVDERERKEKAGTGDTGDSTVPARLTEAKGRMDAPVKEDNSVSQ